MFIAPLFVGGPIGFLTLYTTVPMQLAPRTFLTLHVESAPTATPVLSEKTQEVLLDSYVIVAVLPERLIKKGAEPLAS